MTPEEKAEQFFKRWGGITQFDKSYIIAAHLAGYVAALESDEVKALVKALSEIENISLMSNYDNGGKLAEKASVLSWCKTALAQFEKARGGK